jgi:glutathione S-transferase
VEELKRIFGIYEKRYIKLGTGKYYLGEYFSLADIYLTVYMNVFTKNVGGFQLIKESAPKLADLITRIKNNELKTFFEKYYYD